MPTSTTTAPVLDHVGRDERRDADRGDEHVGVERVPRRGRACASGRASRSRSPACSRCATGLPTMSLRPITTARAPSSSTVCSASSAITPSGVAETIVGPAEVELARVQRMEAVDVLRRRDRADDPRLVDVLRAAAAGRGSRRRRRRRSAPPTFASSSSSVVSAGSRRSVASMPASVAALCFSRM